MNKPAVQFWLCSINSKVQGMIGDFTNYLRGRFYERDKRRLLGL